MLKRLLYLAIPVAALTIIGVQSVSADYYDCEGNIRPGSPGPSECHYLTQPPTNRDVETEPSVRPRCEGRECYNYNYRPNLPDYNYNLILPEDEPEEIVPEDNEPEIRNTRKYCVRDYCYFIYEICYSNGYCEQKAERIEKNEYEDFEPDYDENHSHNRYYWKDSLNNYVYNYFYYNFYDRDDDDCGYYNRGCVYRGAHYGRYHNRYWDF